MKALTPIAALLCLVALEPLAGSRSCLAQGAGWTFTEVAVQAGFDYEHGLESPLLREAHLVSGGVAVGDYDGDGLPDLYAVRGNIGPNLLFRNRGDGTFEERGAAAGVAVDGKFGCGPLFFDEDSDGDLDLWVGGVEGSTPHLFRNRGDGTFEDVLGATGIDLPPTRNTFSMTVGDYDGDLDLDLAMGHWIAVGGGTGHLWRNRGDGTYEDVDEEAGFEPYFRHRDYSFSPNFADIDDDGWPDLLMANDFRTTRVYRNRGDGTFEDATDPLVITDENGMGAAVGDYDGDGDLDWFVTSIWDPDGVPNGNWGLTGNRLYRNRGDGTFEDVTGEAGVSDGYWGWAACFADFDNDGDLDIFHTNGVQVTGAVEFHEDPSRLFLNDGDGTFTERSLELGIDDRDQGRGISCFDYDLDGDLDIFVANNSGPPSLYRNELLAGNHFLRIQLRGRAPNTEAVGARVEVLAGGRTQMREIRVGTNYVSQDPTVAHFGLGAAAVADQVRIRWPGGEESVLHQVEADRLLIADQEILTDPLAIPAASPLGLGLLALALIAVGLRRFGR